MFPGTVSIFKFYNHSHRKISWANMIFQYNALFLQVAMSKPSIFLYLELDGREWLASHSSDLNQRRLDKPQRQSEYGGKQEIPTTDFLVTICLAAYCYIVIPALWVAYCYVTNFIAVILFCIWFRQTGYRNRSEYLPSKLIFPPAVYTAG